MDSVFNQCLGQSCGLCSLSNRYSLVPRAFAFSFLLTQVSSALSTKSLSKGGALLFRVSFPNSPPSSADMELKQPQLRGQGTCPEAIVKPRPIFDLQHCLLWCSSAHYLRHVIRPLHVITLEDSKEKKKKSTPI